jgi:aspartyl protease family protein
MKLRKLFLIILGVPAILILPVLSGARGQQTQELTPYIGETKAQFEARKAGLPQPVVAPDPSSVSILADPKGSFFVESTINESSIRMMVDTGANYVALSETDARSAGIALSPADFKVQVSTANGTVAVAPVLLKKIAVGEIVVNNVPAIVVPEDKLSVSLLGMSFLSKLSYFNESDGRLTLRR